MDKKWFMEVVRRCCVKLVESIGMEAKDADYTAHHKSHIYKQMYICVHAYVLDQNDWINEGKVVPIILIRVGKMINAKRESYKRVYREDNTYHYPQIPGNLMHEKGKDYFTNLKLTGSSEGTAANPKISLLREYQTKILPDIERKVVQRFSEGGTKKVIIVKQEDNAGLHQDQTYVDTMRNEFEQREWILFNQASNSPDCITQD
eukprot:14031077-Ditylum_brightwellii.AAC.1